MKNTTHISPSPLGALNSSLLVRSRVFLLAAAIVPIVLLAQNTAFAGSAKWKQSPATGNWNTAGNWTAGGPPNGPADTATFQSSNTTGVSLSLNTEVNGIVFNAGASAFTITTPASFQLTISGVGITNNSGIAQHFVAGVDGAGNFGVMLFGNSATASSLTIFATTGSMLSGATGGLVEFAQTATAGQGAFNNNGGVVNGAFGGGTSFFGTSTAANGTFANNGSAVSGAFGGQTNFFDSSRAGNGVFTTNGGAVSGASEGFLGFHNTSTADLGSFTVNPGTVSGAFGGFMQFNDNTTAGNGTFINNGSMVLGATGGLTQFAGNSTAGTGIFTVNGD